MKCSVLMPLMSFHGGWMRHSWRFRLEAATINWLNGKIICRLFADVEANSAGVRFSLPRATCMHDCLQRLPRLSVQTEAEPSGHFSESPRKLWAPPGNTVECSEGVMLPLQKNFLQQQKCVTSEVFGLPVLTEWHFSVCNMLCGLIISRQCSKHLLACHERTWPLCVHVNTPEVSNHFKEYKVSLVNQVIEEETSQVSGDLGCFFKARSSPVSSWSG